MICLDLCNKAQLAKVKEKLEGAKIDEVCFDHRAGELRIDTPNGNMTLVLFSGQYIEWESDDEHEMEDL